MSKNIRAALSLALLLAAAACSEEPAPCEVYAAAMCDRLVTCQGGYGALEQCAAEVGRGCEAANADGGDLDTAEACAEALAEQTCWQFNRLEGVDVCDAMTWAR